MALAPAVDRAAAGRPGLLDPDQLDVSPGTEGRVRRRAREGNARSRPSHPNGRGSVYADSRYSEVAIATTTGIDGSLLAERTRGATRSRSRRKDDDTQVGFEFDLARGLAGSTPMRRRRTRRRSGLSASSARRRSRRRGCRSCSIRYTAGQFLGVHRGGADRRGRAEGPVAVRRTSSATSSLRRTLTLIDDGAHPGAPGSAPWDAEGVPTQRTEVIRDGVLRSFLYDVTSRAARAAPRRATHRAPASSRRPARPPPTSLSNRRVNRDEAVLERGRARVPRAGLPRRSLGREPGDRETSRSARPDACSRTARRAKPVKEVTIAAPMLEILGRIVAVADDRRWLPFGGSYGGATTLVAEMTVAGS